jgi:hypothetical protein
MTHFEDGPAKGQILTLGRSPVFLRVVEKDGTWDALDQVDDKPAVGERVHVYRLHGSTGTAFIDGRDPRTGRRFGRAVSIANYRLHTNQPGDEVTRSVSNWRAWCEQEGTRKEAA